FDVPGQPEHRAAAPRRHAAGRSLAARNEAVYDSQPQPGAGDLFARDDLSLAQSVSSITRLSAGVGSRGRSWFLLAHVPGAFATGDDHGVAVEDQRGNSGERLWRKTDQRVNEAPNALLLVLRIFLRQAKEEAGIDISHTFIDDSPEPGAGLPPIAGIVVRHG